MVGVSQKIGKWFSKLDAGLLMCLFVPFLTSPLICHGGGGGTTVTNDPSFTLNWDFFPFSPDTIYWNVNQTPTDPLTGKGPVLRVKVKPTIPSEYLGSNDTLELWVVLGNGNRLGNIMKGKTTLLNNQSIEIDIGGNLYLSSFTGNVSVFAHVRSGAVKSPLMAPYSIPLKYTQASTSVSRNVEYDHQSSYDILSYASDGQAELDYAFGAAYKRLYISLSNSQANPSGDFSWDGSTNYFAFISWYTFNRDQQQVSTHPLYLAGIKNATGNIDSTISTLGISFNGGGGPGFPGISSYVFLEKINGDAKYRKLDTANAVSFVLVHELGHQVSFHGDSITHPEEAPADHNSFFCVMGNDFSNNYSGIIRSFIENPMFCSNDIEKLRTASIP